MAEHLPGGPCWMWPGTTVRDGYGVTFREGKRVYAHRAAFEAFSGPLADDDVVRHRCDTPGCVNPWHLVAGSQSENMKDMMMRGRGRKQFRRKTHCKRGHPLTGDNVGLKVRRDRNGQVERYCKQCVKVRANGG